ncbi:hypothetical protein DM860_014984 [Cuscuta australis]|uniref:Uncharacterized protein n=1 Tax=Cuscuta australis TaxID=267555 RepID=A0A328DJ34_9ASTE|nr:hypothetical protein DM860_014984 [Cuscuta australis]
MIINPSSLDVGKWCTYVPNLPLDSARGTRAPSATRFLSLAYSIPVSVLKEKLAALGSSGVLADHQLQAKLQEPHLKGPS